MNFVNKSFFDLNYEGVLSKSGCEECFFEGRITRICKNYVGWYTYEISITGKSKLPQDLEDSVER